MYMQAIITTVMRLQLFPGYDTEFVIIPIDDVPNADSIYLQITSPQDHDVTVHLIEPDESNEVIYKVPARGVIQVPLNRIQGAEPGKGASNILQLVSGDVIKVEVFDGNKLAEGYTVLFLSALGADYSLPKEDDARFAVVSIMNNTNIQVEDSEGTQVYSVMLEHGQTFPTPAGHGPNLAGGKVHANNPIAVFALLPTECTRQEKEADPTRCTERTVQLLKPHTMARKAWNDCLFSSSACRKGRPKPG